MRIEFENGSVIETVGSSDDKVIRGNGIGIWWIDEEDDEKENILEEAIKND